MNYQSIKDKILQGQQKMTRKELLFLVGEVERRICYFQARLKENYTRNAKLEDEISKLKKSLLAMKQGLDYAERHYIVGPSEQAEVESFFNGQDGSFDALKILAEFEGIGARQ